MLDPGPDFAKTPAQTVEVLRALRDLHELGRPLLLAVSRKDFVGAITGRGPRDRLAGRWPRSARGRRRRPHAARPRRRRGGRLPRGSRGAQRRGGGGFRAAAVDALRWERQPTGIAARCGRGAPCGRSRPGSPRGTLDSRLNRRSLAQRDRSPPMIQRSPMSVLDRTALEAARSPTCTRSPPSFRSTVTAVCAEPS